MNRRFGNGRHLPLGLCVLLLFLLFSQTITAASCQLSGRVTDTLGQPLAGVSVLVVPAGSDTLAMSTDSVGSYAITLSIVKALPSVVLVRAVGFLTNRREIILSEGELRMDFVLSATAIPIRNIEVVSDKERDWLTKRISSEEMRSAAMRSVVPSNPLAAVSIPQLARIGPSLSAMYRIDGSTPQYYLNGLSLGADPAHFGMFSHLPLQAVDQIKISAEGTEASHGAPTCVEMNSPAQFEPHHRGEVQLSLIDGTATYARGGERSFASVTIRRSLIDQLAQRMELGTSRQSIPDPTFQDIVLTSGIRLSRQFRWLTTAYYAWDRLGYQLGTWRSGDYVSDVWSDQNATERYLGCSLLGQFGDVSTTAAVGVRSTSRHYRAYIQGSSDPTDLNVDLRESSVQMNSTLKLGLVRRRTEFFVGWQLQWFPRLQTELQELGWNLLSPFASSNDVFCYQNELNEIYGDCETSLHPAAQAWFGSATWRSARVSFENGIRVEHFGGMRRPTTLGMRHRVAVRIGREIIADAGIGRYYESPISSALESYQIPTRASLHQLIPVNSTVLSGRIQASWFSLDLSRRLIRNVPNMAPDYAHSVKRLPNGTYALDTRFLTMWSIGRIQTTTLAMTLQLPRPLWRQLKPSVSYAWSRSRQSECSVWTPYDLDSPNRWAIQLDFSPPGHLTMGARWQWHTGYPYTPEERRWFMVKGAKQYTSYLSMANSARFNDNIALDVYGQYSWGRWTLFASVANLTNHGNQMIRGAREFIYDAGLLPNIGVRCRF